MDSATDRLFKTNPFDFSASNKETFVQSFAESARAHYAGNDFFRKLWQQHGISPDDIKTEDDVRRAPPIMVHLFKEYELRSVSMEEVVLTLTSSGTGGRKSRIYLNSRSLERVKLSALQIHKYLGMVSDDEVNYLCFSYDPEVAKDLGTSFTDELLTRFTKRKSVYYTFQWHPEKKEFFFNEPGTLEALRRFQKEGNPVRILGLPAYLYRILDSYPDLKFNFGKNSWVQTGGGWKALSHEEIPKGRFRQMMSTRLGIPEENVRDMFGMVEHGIPYVDCEKGNMHIPNYARVYVKSADGKEFLPEGQTGLLQFCCSYVDSYPSISILTTDWGSIGQCSCSIPGPTLVLGGRAGVTKHKGCALTTLEKVK